MNSDLATARIYTDFQGLADLRRSARQDSDEALHEVAAQFEAIFIKMMFKSMRDASLADGLFDSDQSEMYLDMLDNQVALDLSSKGVFGISEMLVRQLGKNNGSQLAAPVNAAADDNVQRERVEPGKVQFSSPGDFVSRLMPDASRAAEKLGIKPELLVAQAALETGWGERVIKRTDGSSSFNLFGIKASRNWEGDSVRVSTLEYRDGVMQKEKADFRAYGSFRESFDDYVDFVTGDRRYSSAIDHHGSSEKYIEGLQQAGYATDPAYAAKVLDIMQRARG